MNEKTERQLEQKLRMTIGRLGASVAFDETIRPHALTPDETTVRVEVGSDSAASLAGQKDLDVLRLLGLGGMGRVHLARQPSLDRDVAVKTVRPDVLTPELSFALLEESRITGSLEHPNIIPVHSIGVDNEGGPFLVMKRVEGTAWSDLIAKRPPTHERLSLAPRALNGGEDNTLAADLEILVAVCDAVHFAHRRGVIHRDIKPANVMVGDFGEVYLVDWGVATALNPSDPRYRKERLALVGTPAFLAPEMLADDGGVVDERTDVYLLGATLHFLLTGRPRHDGSTMMETFYHAATSEPASYDASVPKEIGAIANRACEKDAALRYASAAAFRDAVRDFLSHRGSIILSENARIRLDAVQARWAAASLVGSSEDRARVRLALTECKFGFSHALEVWDQNPRATEGLRLCSLLALRDDIAQENLVGAEAALLEVDEPPEDVIAGLAALRETARERSERDARYRERDRRDDWSVSAGVRIAFFAAIAVLGVVLWLSNNQWQVHYRGGIPPRKLATSVGVALGLITAMVLALRRHLLTSRVNEQLVYGALMAVSAMFLNRVANCWPVPYSATLVSTELLFCALGSALGGLILARWLWLQVPIWVAGALLVRAVPSYAGLVFACSALLALAIGAWLLRTGASATRSSGLR